MKAFDFSLQNQDDRTVKLFDYRGRRLVLYFYPKDDTPGCTTEACSFRDFSDQFKAKNVAVLGISKDSPASHRKFIEKYHLNFDLLSDPTAEAIKAYGAWGAKKFLGKTFEGILRTTFVIGPDGNIEKTYPNVTPNDHVQEILSGLTGV